MLNRTCFSSNEILRSPFESVDDRSLLISFKVLPGTTAFLFKSVLTMAFLMAILKPSIATILNLPFSISKRAPVRMGLDSSCEMAKLVCFIIFENNSLSIKNEFVSSIIGNSGYSFPGRPTIL